MTTEEQPAASPQTAAPASWRPAPFQDDIARLAYRLWEERGRPFGSPQQDRRAAENALAKAA